MHPNRKTPKPLIVPNKTLHISIISKTKKKPGNKIKFLAKPIKQTNNKNRGVHKSYQIKKPKVHRWMIKTKLTDDDGRQTGGRERECKGAAFKGKIGAL